MSTRMCSNSAATAARIMAVNYLGIVKALEVLIPVMKFSKHGQIALMGSFSGAADAPDYILAGLHARKFEIAFPLLALFGRSCFELCLIQSSLARLQAKQQASKGVRLMAMQS